MFSCLQMANHRSNGKENYTPHYLFSSGRKTPFILEKSSPTAYATSNIHKDTKLSSLAFSSSLSLGTQEDLNIHRILDLEIILQIIKIKVIISHMNLRKAQEEVICPVSLTDDLGVIKLVFLLNTSWIL